MFFLHGMVDTIRVPPKYFSREKREVLVKLLEDKYSNRVVRDVGLCICVHDLTRVGDSHVYPGDGAAHADVEFDMVVFRPFPGEVLEGVVRQNTKNFVQVSLGFFEDVYVAATSLPQPSEFSAETGMGAFWTWKYFDSEKGADGDAAATSGGEAAEAAADPADEEQGYFIEKDHAVRVMVKAVEFGTPGRRLDKAIASASASAAAAAAAVAGGPPGAALADGGGDDSVEDVVEDLQTKAPMIVMAQMQDTYLGMCEWWDDAPEEEEDEGEAGDEGDAAAAGDQ